MTGFNNMWSFAWNIGLLTPLLQLSWKINPTLWRFEGNPCEELTEMYMTGLNKMSNFTQNIGLLPFVAIVSKN